MTDYLWPTSVVPQRSEIMLRDLSSRFSSPFTGTARTYQRPGGELRMMRLEMPPMVPAQKAAVTGLLSKLRGGVHRVWCKDHSYVKRGSFPTGELLANNTFTNGTTGWTATYSSGHASDGVLRQTAGVHTAGQYPQHSQMISVTSGAAYVARALIQNVVTGTIGTTGIYMDTTSGTPVFSYLAAPGLFTVSQVASATGGSFLFAQSPDVNVNDTIDVAFTSVSRCALVKGASQTGARILIDALPTSANGLLLEGDQVQIGEELFTAVAPVNSNAGGEAYIHLHRPPRVAPADNAPVIIHEPMGLFMLAENENGWQNVPGRFANASVSLIEAVR